MFDPMGVASVLDTSCNRVTLTYVGGHTGSSFSRKISVAAGHLAIADEQEMSQTEIKHMPRSVSEWGYSVSYYVVPGESIVLHDPALSRIIDATCSS
jgi:hypothetical protein